ncbi:MAG: hypothetical protein ACYSUF_03765 [Planctomycetota bacterium]
MCKLDPSCCQLDGWDQACADLALANCPLAAVESGDVVIGLSNDNVDPADTLALARGDAVLNGGVLIDDSWAQPFMQSMEFDNLDGLTHNPQGNLLAVNFGTTADGGSIYSLATCEVVGPGQLIGNTTGLGGTGITLSQLGGLSVSPDNTKIAVTAYTTGKVIVYDYVAGDCMGAGAVLTNARETAQAPMCITDTQGTTWLDDGVVLAFSSLGTVWAVDATTMGTTALASHVEHALGARSGQRLGDREPGRLQHLDRDDSGDRLRWGGQPLRVAVQRKYRSHPERRRQRGRPGRQRFAGLVRHGDRGRFCLVPGHGRRDRRRRTGAVPGGLPARAQRRRGRQRLPGLDRPMGRPRLVRP